MTPRRGLGLGAIAAGILLAAAARVLVPGAPPLYDGVIVNEPYRWLEPPPGALGGAQGVSDTVTFQGGVSPLIALATAEQPPQAQVFAPPGGLTLPAGSRSLALSISPIPPEATPADGRIAGNVYRIVIANQDGVPVTAPADSFVSVVMRGPEEVLEATIARFVGGTWQPLDTSHAGYTNGFLAIVTEFGDFALVVEGETPSAAPTASPTPSAGGGVLGGVPAPLLVIGLVVAVLLLAGGAVLFSRSRRAPRRPERARGRRRKR